MSMKAQEMNISPIMAERFLRKNAVNRKVYESTVDKYALDMKRGLWATTHQGISFDESGYLQDGQHRLNAIIRSGKTIRMLVVTNVPETYGSNGSGQIRTQLAVDGGKPRGIGDQLNLNFGIQNANMVAAVCRTILEICTGKKGLALSPLTIKNVYDLYDSEIDAVIHLRGNIPGLPVAGALGSMAFAARKFRDQIIDFGERYFSGANLDIGSPILTYRNYMLNRTKGMGISNATKQAIVMYGLNAMKHHVLQEPLKRLVMTRSGLEFFMNKQKKLVSEINELIRL